MKKIYKTSRAYESYCTNCMWWGLFRSSSPVSLFAITFPRSMNVWIWSRIVRDVWRTEINDTLNPLNTIRLNSGIFLFVFCFSFNGKKCNTLLCQCVYVFSHACVCVCVLPLCIRIPTKIYRRRANDEAGEWWEWEWSKAKPKYDNIKTHRDPAAETLFVKLTLCRDAKWRSDDAIPIITIYSLDVYGILLYTLHILELHIPFKWTRNWLSSNHYKCRTQPSISILC